MNLDIFSQLEQCCDFPYTITVLEETIHELEEIIQKQRGKYKLAAKLALSIIAAKQIPILKEIGSADELLIQHSDKGDLVLTQDIELKKRLTKPYLTIRQKKKIVVIE